MIIAPCHAKIWRSSDHAPLSYLPRYLGFS